MVVTNTCGRAVAISATACLAVRAVSAAADRGRPYDMLRTQIRAHTDGR